MDLGFLVPFLQSDLTPLAVIFFMVVAMVWYIHQKGKRINVLETENDELRDKITEIVESNGKEIADLKVSNAKLEAEVNKLRQDLQNCMDNWKVVLTQTGAMEPDALATLITDRQGG